MLCLKGFGKVNEQAKDVYGEKNDCAAPFSFLIDFLSDN